MAAEERWYFQKERLQQTGSRECGIDPDKELSYRQQAANFIQDMGQRLPVNQLCINTAIVYMHRFYVFHSFSKFHRNSIATCALFLAAKVEEQPRKLEHVIKVAHMCLNREGPPLDTKSEAYLEQAQQLVMNENIMLQTLGFDVAIDHPHTHIVKCCQLVRASKDLAQTSYFMATNSLHLTTMCLQYKPTVVACVCIHLACKWARWEIPSSSEGREWFWYVEKTITLELLEELTAEFLAILDKCPSRLKKKILTASSGKDSGFPEKKFRSDPNAAPTGMTNYMLSLEKGRSPVSNERTDRSTERLSDRTTDHTKGSDRLDRVEHRSDNRTARPDRASGSSRPDKFDRINRPPDRMDKVPKITERLERPDRPDRSREKVERSNKTTRHPPHQPQRSETVHRVNQVEKPHEQKMDNRLDPVPVTSHLRILSPTIVQPISPIPQVQRNEDEKMVSNKRKAFIESAKEQPAGNGPEPIAGNSQQYRALAVQSDENPVIGGERVLVVPPVDGSNLTSPVTKKHRHDVPRMPTTKDHKEYRDKKNKERPLVAAPVRQKTPPAVVKHPRPQHVSDKVRHRKEVPSEVDHGASNNQSDHGKMLPPSHVPPPAPSPADGKVREPSARRPVMPASEPKQQKRVSTPSNDIKSLSIVLSKIDAAKADGMDNVVNRVAGHDHNKKAKPAPQILEPVPSIKQEPKQSAVSVPKQIQHSAPLQKPHHKEAYRIPDPLVQKLPPEHVQPPQPKVKPVPSVPPQVPPMTVHTPVEKPVPLQPTGKHERHERKEKHKHKDRDRERTKEKVHDSSSVETKGPSTPPQQPHVAAPSATAVPSQRIKLTIPKERITSGGHDSSSPLKLKIKKEVLVSGPQKSSSSDSLKLKIKLGPKPDKSSAHCSSKGNEKERDSRKRDRDHSPRDLNSKSVSPRSPKVPRMETRSSRKDDGSAPMSLLSLPMPPPEPLAPVSREVTRGTKVEPPVARNNNGNAPGNAYSNYNRKGPSGKANDSYKAKSQRMGNMAPYHQIQMNAGPYPYTQFYPLHPYPDFSHMQHPMGNFYQHPMFHNQPPPFPSGNPPMPQMPPAHHGPPPLPRDPPPPNPPPPPE